MSAHFSAGDLRALADALDSLTETTLRTSVLVERYGEASVTMHDEPIRLRWESGDSTAEAQQGGRYVVELPVGT